MGRNAEIRVQRSKRCSLSGAALFCRSSGGPFRSAPTPLLRCQQSPTDHIKIDQRRRDFESMQILGKAAVTDLAEAEYALDHADGVLHLGAHLRLGPVLGLLHRVEPTSAAVLAVGEVLGAWCSSTNRRALTLITPITSYSRLASVKQVGQRLA